VKNFKYFDINNVWWAIKDYIANNNSNLETLLSKKLWISLKEIRLFKPSGEEFPSFVDHDESFISSQIFKSI